MNKVRGRALNANAQNTNNYSMWMEPLSHRDYPVTHVINPTNNAVLTSDGVKNTVIAQPGLLYNKVRLDVSGSVNPTRWTTGQTINTVFLQSGDMNQIATAITNGTVAFYSYTPISNNSKIIVEYSGLYRIGGSASDLYESQIVIDGTTMIAKRQQFYENHSGGGTRSGTIFPICGGFNNTGLTGRIISITLATYGDAVQFYNQPFDACMKITEISL